MDGFVASAGRVMPSLHGHFGGIYDSVAFKPELMTWQYDSIASTRVDGMVVNGQQVRRDDCRSSHY